MTVATLVVFSFTLLLVNGRVRRPPSFSCAALPTPQSLASSLSSAVLAERERERTGERVSELANDTHEIGRNVPRMYLSCLRVCFTGTVVYIQVLSLLVQGQSLWRKLCPPFVSIRHQRDRPAT